MFPKSNYFLLTSHKVCDQTILVEVLKKMVDSAAEERNLTFQQEMGCDIRRVCALIL